MERTKVICSRLDCKYCNENSICQRDNVHFSYHSVFTVNDGRQEYLQCKEYQEDDDEAIEAFRLYLRNGRNK